MKHFQLYRFCGKVFGKVNFISTIVSTNDDIKYVLLINCLQNYQQPIGCFSCFRDTNSLEKWYDFTVLRHCETGIGDGKFLAGLGQILGRILETIVNHAEITPMHGQTLTASHD